MCEVQRHEDKSFPATDQHDVPQGLSSGKKMWSRHCAKGTNSGRALMDSWMSRTASWMRSAAARLQAMTSGTRASVREPRSVPRMGSRNPKTQTTLLESEHWKGVGRRVRSEMISQKREYLRVSWQMSWPRCGEFVFAPFAIRTAPLQVDLRWTCFPCSRYPIVSTALAK